MMTHKELIAKREIESLVKQVEALKHELNDARAEVEQVKIDSDSAVQALHEQIRVQKSISDAHYENYCEMLKRVDAVAKERNEARDEVAQLRAERDLAQQLGRDEVSSELERLKTELAQAISERTPDDYGLLKYTIESLKEELHQSREELAKVKRQSINAVTVSFSGIPTSSGGGGGRACGNNHLPEAEKMVSPEPSRLEIAAMLVASRFSNTVYVTEVQGTWIKYALDGADALIAAAKEVAK